ncbi:branched-chain amino acid ABC transporter permease [Aeromicrobium choanae]|uniref:Branched-chain amino acid transport system permease protein n=1 Tax=Aeromicrobium choanae TaxID=1736691 RepID=A0A1T4YWT3_9ACTN|nr:branched-chain amino acid ABC transporter permease [Aeromicrobium choanae]SKB06259.1 branched-chain amino acid transport system permease protein [Aeromicrobium choanae]
MLQVLPKKLLWALGAAALVVAVLLPRMVEPYTVRVAALILVFTVFATGLNIILGFTGLLSFGHAAFFGVGAYVTARLLLDTGMPLLLVMVCATVGAGVVGLLVGLTSWRSGGDYLALVTLGVGQIFYLFLINEKELTGGATGLPGVPAGNFFGWDLAPLENTYTFILAVAVLVTIFAWVLGRSYFGRAMLAVREDEIIARAHGINVPLTKVLSFGIGSAIAGLAGVLQVLLLGFVGPATFKVDQSILVVEIVLIGGMATTIGPLLGSALVIGSTEYLRALADYRSAVFGVLMLVILLWRPGGLAQIFGLSSRTPNAVRLPFVGKYLTRRAVAARARKIGDGNAEDTREKEEVGR